MKLGGRLKNWRVPMTLKFLIEVFLFAFLFLVMSTVWLILTLPAMIGYIVRMWFREREEYVKRMSILPVEKEDEEYAHLN